MLLMHRLVSNPGSSALPCCELHRAIRFHVLWCYACTLGFSTGQANPLHAHTHMHMYTSTSVMPSWPHPCATMPGLFSLCPLLCVRVCVCVLVRLCG